MTLGSADGTSPSSDFSSTWVLHLRFSGALFNIQNNIIHWTKLIFMLLQCVGRMSTGPKETVSGKTVFFSLFQNLYSPKLFINTEMLLSLVCTNAISTQRVSQQDAVKICGFSLCFSLCCYLVQQIKFTSATTQGQSCGPFGNHPIHCRTEWGCLSGKSCQTEAMPGKL